MSQGGQAGESSEIKDSNTLELTVTLRFGVW